jgi:hypothetical protein
MTKTEKIPDYVQYLYTGPDQEKRFKCRICGLSRKHSGNTWSNVQKHLHEKHPDWKEQVQQLKNGGTLDK